MEELSIPRCRLILSGWDSLQGSRTRRAAGSTGRSYLRDTCGSNLHFSLLPQGASNASLKARNTPLSRRRDGRLTVKQKIADRHFRHDHPGPLTKTMKVVPVMLPYFPDPACLRWRDVGGASTLPGCGGIRAECQLLEKRAVKPADPPLYQSWTCARHCWRSLKRWTRIAGSPVNLRGPADIDAFRRSKVRKQPAMSDRGSASRRASLSPSTRTIWAYRITARARCKYCHYGDHGLRRALRRRGPCQFRSTGLLIERTDRR